MGLEIDRCPPTDLLWWLWQTLKVAGRRLLKRVTCICMSCRPIESLTPRTRFGMGIHGAFGLYSRFVQLPCDVFVGVYVMDTWNPPLPTAAVFVQRTLNVQNLYEPLNLSYNPQTCLFCIRFLGGPICPRRGLRSLGSKILPNTSGDSEDAS